MSDTNARLIDKIKKLLALAANNPSQAEAEAASAKVQELLAAHNIEMSQVENDTPTGPVYEARTKTPHDRSALYQYQRRLMEQLARNNFCMHFIREMAVFSNGKNRRAKRHVLLGRQVNIMSTIMVYDYLVDTADKLLPYFGMEKRGKDALAWLDGFSEAVCRRLEQRRQDSLTASKQAQTTQPKTATGGNALVLSEVYSNEDDLNIDALYGYEPGTTARRRHESEARVAARQAELAAKERSLVEEDGYSVDDAWYVARGYAVSSQEKLSGKAETDAEYLKRVEREQREARKWQERQDRAYRKEYRRQSNPVFQAGVETGRKVGLDTQVGRDERKAIG